MILPLFLYKTESGPVLLVYVDDVAIIRTNIVLIQQLKQQLQALFHMKDFGSHH